LISGASDLQALCLLAMRRRNDQEGGWWMAPGGSSAAFTSCLCHARRNYNAIIYYPITMISIIAHLKHVLPSSAMPTPDPPLKSHDP
jgi:hypothetical protein